jgi:hypothetical protein
VAAAILAFIGQLTLVTASNAEGWRHDAAAHVERGGTQAHHAHNEATCVACATQVLHARPAVRVPTLPVPERQRTVAGAPVETRTDLTPDYSHGSRAPPV